MQKAKIASPYQNMSPITSKHFFFALIALSYSQLIILFPRGHEILVPLVFLAALWSLLQASPLKIALGIALLVALLTLGIAISSIPNESDFGKLNVFLIVFAVFGAALSISLADRNVIRHAPYVFATLNLPVLASFALAFEQWDDSRLSLFGANPIWLARSLSLGVLGSLFIAHSGSGLRKLVLFGYSAMGLVAMFATGSRGPFLSLSIALIYLYISNGRVLQRSAFIFFTCLTFGIVLLAIQGAETMPIRMFDFSSEESGTMARPEMWLSSIFKIASEPQGIGLGQFTYYYAFEYPHNVRRQNIWRNWLLELAECRPLCLVDVRRPVCGVASAVVRLSVV